MNSKKAKLIHKAAIQLWEQKPKADRERWGRSNVRIVKKMFKNKMQWVRENYGLDMATAFKRFYRHLKRDYIRGAFTIN